MLLRALEVVCAADHVAHGVPNQTAHTTPECIQPKIIELILASRTSMCGPLLISISREAYPNERTWAESPSVGLLGASGALAKASGT